MPAISQSLRDHLEGLHGAAYVAESLIDTIVSCGGDPKRTTLALTLAAAAQEILAELGRGLDSVELAKVASQ